ncbi:MAG: lactonase family protein [Bryobacteraceae bacterium]
MAIERPLKLALAGLILSAFASAEPKAQFLYVGNYSNGIQAFRYDPQALALQPVGMVGEMQRPSFLTLHPNGRFLYAVSEIGNDGGSQGYVYAFSVDQPTGKLHFLNRQPSAGGGPCHLVVNKSGKFLLVANYGSGSVADFPLKDDGSIGDLASKLQFEGSGPDQKRQKGPHAHAVVLSSDDRFLFVPDLGTDLVRIFRFEPRTGALTANKPGSASVKPGAGPRHFAIAPNGRFAYVLDEMGSSVTAFKLDGSSGALTEIEAVSTLPDDNTKINNSAEIQIDPAGNFLYASNRGHDSIAVFSIDRQSGKLNRVQIVPSGGATPRNFTIDPAGKHVLVANQDSNNIVLFDRDLKTGKLTPADKTVTSPSPVCLMFSPQL